LSLETAYEWLALLRSNWDDHCCYQENPQPDRYDFAGSLHNFILLFDHVRLKP